MKKLILGFSVMTTAFSGCAEQAPEATQGIGASAQVAALEEAGMKAARASEPAKAAEQDALAAAAESSAAPETPATATAAGAESAVAPASGDSIALTEANTKVEFVGTHSGDMPDPRKGSFGKLTGSATLEGGALKSIVVDFDTTSLSTEIDKLTDHLKAPDFFNVKEHPTAKFESTSIEAGDAGAVNITGNLTLLGVTKPVTFPATVTADGGLKLSAEFSIDRTEFGMTYGEGKVEKLVALTVTIGG
jgi:polyisoprenoid-binding protein YceI